MGLKRFINENDKNVKIALCYFKGDTSVDLSVKSEENVEYMVEAIKEKLRMVNAGAMRALVLTKKCTKIYVTFMIVL